MFGVESMENITKIWKHSTKIKQNVGKILKITSRNITYETLRKSSRICFGTFQKVM